MRGRKSFHALRNALDATARLMHPRDYDLQARYDHFNALAFGGALPRIPLEWFKSDRMGGEVRAKFRRAVDDEGQALPQRLARLMPGGGRTLLPGSLSLRLSANWEREPEAFDALLLHEMVHVSVMLAGELREMHGPQFMIEAARVGKATGIAVPLIDGRHLETAPVDDTLRPVGLVVVRGFGGEGRAAYFRISDRVAACPDEALTKACETLRSATRSVEVWRVQSPAWTDKARRISCVRVYKASRLAWMPTELEADLARHGQRTFGG